MATIAKYEEDKSYAWISGTVTALSVSSPMHDVFSDLHTRGYDSVMDNMMITLHGSEELIAGYDTTIATKSVADMILTAFLEEKAPYIRQCMAYIDAEYNPVENYSGVEHEVIEDDYGARSKSYTTTQEAASDNLIKGATLTTYTNAQRTDTDTIGQNGYNVEFHEAKKSSVTTAGTAGEQTTTVAPEDSSTFYNKEKVTQTVPGSTVITSRVAEGSDGGKDITHYDQRSDQHIIGQHTDTVGGAAATDTTNYGARSGGGSENELTHKDTHTRDLERSGNLGVMTAADMMVRDKAFWESFNWLSQLTLQLCERVCQGVMAL